MPAEASGAAAWREWVFAGSPRARRTGRADHGGVARVPGFDPGDRDAGVETVPRADDPGDGGLGGRFVRDVGWEDETFAARGADAIGHAFELRACPPEQPSACALSANRIAVASPIPDPAPVTRARRPASLLVIGSSLLVHGRGAVGARPSFARMRGGVRL